MLQIPLAPELKRYVGYETAGSSDTVVSKQLQGSYAMVGYYGNKLRPSQESPRT